MLLGLRELQKTWDVTNWVLQLFFQFLDNSTAKILQHIDPEDSAVQPIATDSHEPFGTKEAEDFSMLQLQPELLNCDIFGVDMDQYFNSIMPQWYSGIGLNEGAASEAPFSDTIPNML